MVLEVDRLEAGNHVLLIVVAHHDHDHVVPPGPGGIHEGGEPPVGGPIGLAGLGALRPVDVGGGVGEAEVGEHEVGWVLEELDDRLDGALVSEGDGGQAHLSAVVAAAVPGVHEIGAGAAEDPDQAAVADGDGRGPPG